MTLNARSTSADIARYTYCPDKAHAARLAEMPPVQDFEGGMLRRVHDPERPGTFSKALRILSAPFRAIYSAWTLTGRIW